MDETPEISSLFLLSVCCRQTAGFSGHFPVFPLNLENPPHLIHSNRSQDILRRGPRIDVVDVSDYPRRRSALPTKPW